MGRVVAVVSARNVVGRKSNRGNPMAESDPICNERRHAFVAPSLLGCRSSLVPPSPAVHFKRPPTNRTTLHPDLPQPDRPYPSCYSPLLPFDTSRHSPRLLSSRHPNLSWSRWRRSGPTHRRPARKTHLKLSHRRRTPLRTSKVHRTQYR